MELDKKKALPMKDNDMEKDGIKPMQVSERQVQTRSPTRCCLMIG